MSWTMFFIIILCIFYSRGLSASDKQAGLSRLPMNNSVAAYLWFTPFHVDTLQLELRYFSGWHQSNNFANNNYVAEFCLFQEVVNSLPARLRLVLRFPCANIAALAQL